MASFFDDNADLQYYAGPGVDWDTLAWVTEFGFRHPEGFADAEQAKAFYREVLSTVGTFAAEEIAPGPPRSTGRRFASREAR